MLQATTADATLRLGFEGSLDWPTLEELRAAVAAAAEDERVRLLVLDCAGGDGWPDAQGEWPARLAHRRPAGSHGPGPLPEQDAVRALRGFMKPTLALLDGDVRSIAFDLACACDTASPPPAPPSATPAFARAAPPPPASPTCCRN